MCVCVKEREKEDSMLIYYLQGLMDERRYYQYKLNKEFRDFRVSFSLIIYSIKQWYVYALAIAGEYELGPLETRNIAGLGPFHL